MHEVEYYIMNALNQSWQGELNASGTALHKDGRLTMW